MTHRDHAVFVDTSGRRGRLMRYVATLVGVICVGFVAVIVAGLFGAVPSGGALPWSPGDGGKAPVHAEESAEPPAPTSTKKSSTVPAADTSAAASPAEDASSTPRKATTAPAQSATSAPATSAAPAPATTAPSASRGNGNGNGSSRSTAAPGSTKGPK
ncbi:hypothetical protein ACFU8W_15285 [Streptomyces sp. NPDC057565]|uniref:hypothetical protein n=1 Tax=Streptomyces sp. NPDC057565 TaxID=3346169 RepID=UPI0036AEEA0C